MVGNLERAYRYLDKIFNSFLTAPYTLTDDEINQYVYLLLNNIMRYLMFLPMSIRMETPVVYRGHSSLKDLRSEVDQFIKEVFEKITATDDDDSTVFENSLLRYIDDHFTENSIDLGTIAEELSLNKNYVSKVIKEITGRNLPEYINDKRILRSLELLKKPNRKIKEVAEEVGFTYSYYFIRVFKKSQGITPGEYQKLIIKICRFVSNYKFYRNFRHNSKTFLLYKMYNHYIQYSIIIVLFYQ